MPQSDSLPDEVADEIAKLDKRLRDLERTPQLTRSSIDDGRLVSKDRGGRIREVIGKQADGSHGSRVVESPDQPTPDAPVLSVGKTGVVAVRWSGGADAPVPLVHGHVEVQAMGPSDADWQVVGTIRDRSGGATTFAADESGTTQVRLVLVGQDRVTRSEASAASSVEVELPASTSEVQAAVESADGKNVITYDPAPPAADGAGEGDIHFQIDDVTGVVQQAWRWDGSSWAEQSFGDEVLDSISAGKITAGTIEAAVGIGSQGYIRSTDADGRTSEMVGGGFFSEDSTGQVVFDTRGGQLQALGATIEGGTVTGSTFETSPDWASAGGATMRTDGQYGHFVAAGSDGTIMARLGGDENTLTGVDVQGRFQTSYSGGSGLTIDYGTVDYYSLRTSGWRETTGPYIRLEDGVGDGDDQPVITVDTWGSRPAMVLAPGRDSTGETRYITLDGRVLMNSAVASADFRANTVTARDGSTDAVLNAGQLTLLDGTARYMSDGMLIEPSASSPTGLVRTGSRTRVVGRMESPESSNSMFFSGQTYDSWTVDPGGGHRVNFSFSSPAPFGSRNVVASPRVSTGTQGWDNFRSAAMSVTNESAGGFGVVVRAPAENSGPVQYSIAYTWAWK